MDVVEPYLHRNRETEFDAIEPPSRHESLSSDRDVIRTPSPHTQTPSPQPPSTDGRSFSGGSPSAPATLAHRGDPS